MPKRRANGEGNIRKRKDGRWEGRYTAGYDPESGKRIIKNVLGKTQAEVKEKLKTAISESQKLSKAGNYTVASWVCGRGTRSTPSPASGPTQRRTTPTTIENPHRPRNWGRPAGQADHLQIQLFYNNLQKPAEFKIFLELRTKASAPEWCGRPHAAAQLPEQAVAERLILTNPAQGCRRSSKTGNENSAARENRDVPCAGAPGPSRGLLSGADHRLRRGELLAIQWTDLM